MSFAFIGKVHSTDGNKTASKGIMNRRLNGRRYKGD